MSSASSIHAVLTGDIVRSSRLEPAALEGVREAVASAVKAAGDWRDGLVVGGAEFFRGDSWQVLLTEPGMALRVALFVRAWLRGAGLPDSRIAIGVGRVAQVSAERISLSTGEAFQVSGAALDGMGGGARMAFAAGAGVARERAKLLGVAVALCDALVVRWSRRQAQALRLAVGVEAPTQEAIGASLEPPVSRQAVAKLLDGAGWHALREAVTVFDRLDWSRPDNADVERGQC